MPVIFDTKSTLEFGPKARNCSSYLYDIIDENNDMMYIYIVLYSIINRFERLSTMNHLL